MDKQRSFSVTTPGDSVPLDAGRGQVAFTVSNVSARPVRGRARPVALGDAREAWLTVEGEAERDFAANETQQVVVRVAAPDGSPAGRYAFRLDAVAVANPDDDYAQGPAIAFEVRPAPALKKFPLWPIAVAVVALLLIAAGLVWYFLRAPSAVEARFETSAEADPTNRKVRFTNRTTGRATGYTWLFGDDTPPNHDRDPEHEYQDAGTYQVTLVADGPGGAEPRTTQQTIRLARPARAAFVPQPSSGHAPLAVKFNDGSEGDSLSWSWDFGDPGSGPNNTSAEPSPAHTYERKGTYTAKLTVTGPGRANQSSQTVPVLVEEVDPVDFTAEPMSGPVGTTVKFTESGRVALTNRKWDFGEDAAPEQRLARNPQHTYSKPGYYEVLLVGDDPQGRPHVVRKAKYVKIDPARCSRTSHSAGRNPLNGRVMVSFNYSAAAGAQHYVLEVERSEGNAWTAFKKVGDNVLPFLSDFWDMPAGSYRWRVTAVSAPPDSVAGEPSDWGEFEVK